MRFTSWAEIVDTATKAERALKDAAEAGEPCVLGPLDHIPPAPNNWQTLAPTHHIRAEVLRFILLSEQGGGITEKGLMLGGAYISGRLSLTDCTIPHKLVLMGCRFQEPLQFDRSQFIKDLGLRSCAAPALSGNAMTVGGQLGCDGAKFLAKAGRALNLQRAKIDADLFLRGAKFHATADLSGIEIGGQLACEGAEFLARDAQALNLQSATIDLGLYLRKVKHISGPVDLHSASVTTLIDDPFSWPAQGQLILNGLTYNGIVGATDAKTRLDWLSRGDHWNGVFFPQPYKQLAKVLHDMGHEDDALKVRVALACKLRQEQRTALMVTPNGDLSVGVKSLWHDLGRLFLWIWHSVSLALTGHGFRSERSLFWLVLLWALAVYPAHKAWEEGSFAPNAPPVLVSAEWKTLAETADNPAAEWSNAVPGKDWETFNRYAYAADLVIPILNLGQTDAWAPSTERGPWGWHLWWLRWLLTALGWIVTALGAAALTGVIRRE